jgi:predicted small metal-binding protein
MEPFAFKRLRWMLGEPSWAEDTFPGTWPCWDVGFYCEGVIHARSVEEVLPQAAEHAQTRHGAPVIPEAAAQVCRQDRDEDMREESSSAL